MAKLKGGTYVAGTLTVEDTLSAGAFATTAGVTLSYILSSMSSQVNYIPKFNASGSAEFVKSIITDNGSTVTVAGALTATGDIKGASIYIEEEANSSYYLRLYANSGLTANRTLTINTSNADRTLTMGGDITTSGAYALTMTLTGTTSITLPTSGTLAVNNQTMYIGTTAVTINRSSAALTLAGVSLSTLTISTTSNRTTSAGGTYNGSAAATIYVYEPGQDLETISSPTFAAVTAASFTASSKRSLKKNIVEYTENALAMLNSVKVVSFNMKADEASKNYRVGFIADDTHEHLSGKDHDTMDLGNSIGVLIKAVQELSAEVERLKKPWWARRRIKNV